jgi:hypothetical protein
MNKSQIWKQISSENETPDNNLFFGNKVKIIEPKVIQLEPHGPADVGMSEMQLDPAGFQSDLSVLICSLLKAY